MSAFSAAFRRSPRDRAIFALSLPALVTLALDPVVSIVDTAWVGRLGTVSLAALAIASAIFAALFSILNFMHNTVTPLVAGEVGRGNLNRAGSIASGAVVIAAVVGVVVGGLAIATAPAVIGFFGAEPAVAAEAETYLRIRLLALPAMLVAMVGHGVYRGHSDTKTPLWVAAGMSIVNLVLDPILIYGASLGVAGAAWATVVAQVFAAIWFLILMYGVQRHRLGIGRHMRRLGDLGIGRILAAGWPMMVRSAALLVAITAVTAAASRIGTVDVAAHQIALQVWLFLAFVLDAYAVAASAMIGTDLGAEHRRDAREVANRLLALGLMTGLGLSVLLLASAPIVASIFGAEPAVEEALRTIYPFVIVLQPLTALVYVWDGIGIGASAFGYLAASMVVAAVVTIATLALIGNTLVGVWVAVTVLTMVRLVALAGWHVFGPLAPARDPSLSSPAA